MTRLTGSLAEKQYKSDQESNGDSESQIVVSYYSDTNLSDESSDESGETGEEIKLCSCFGLFSRSTPAPKKEVSIDASKPHGLFG
jgi:hypothetical protein